MYHTDPAQLSIGKALGRVPSGVYVLTAAHDGTATAMLASWVQQAAFAPPSVSVAIAKGRSIADMIRASRQFALSIIARDDTTLMKKYARGLTDGENPFAGVRTRPGSLGLPILTDALAYLECRLVRACDFGADHELFLAEVVAGAMLRDGYAFAHQRGNGFHY
jgi:flavin reductase (DIM6/NTAB) family NADH-FMN oxidoreductase RutF